MSSSNKFTDVLQLDRLIHEPARLLILSILAGADEVEFGFVEQLSGLSKGNLSSHLSKLEAAAWVDIQKKFRGKKPLTTLRITAAGLNALAEYRQRLAEVLANIPTTSAAHNAGSPPNTENVINSKNKES